MIVSVHQDALDGVRENFRTGEFTDRIYVFSERRFSSAGGVGTLDMMLALIEHHESQALANRVCRMMNHERRPQGSAVRREYAARPAHPLLARCVDLMYAHIEDPLSLDQLSAAASAPPWTLRRLFRRHLASSPTGYYQSIRLDRARALLAYSHLSVAEVSVACGYSEVASLSRAFRQHFGVAPSRSRHDEPGLPR